MPAPIRFQDHPEFEPNLTPARIFRAGVFGGTYFRDIYSSVTKRRYVGPTVARKYKCLKGIPPSLLTRNDGGDVLTNRYKVKVSMSLEYWEEHHWIDPSRPYGWLEWYCGFFDGKRTADDARQIKRWQGVAGEKGRFRRRLINEGSQSKSKYNDPQVLPKIRQILLTWGYELTKKDAAASSKN